jgi:hypothetical protein
LNEALIKILQHPSQTQARIAAAWEATVKSQLNLAGSFVLSACAHFN